MYNRPMAATSVVNSVISELEKKGFKIGEQTIQIPKEDNPDEYEEKKVNYTRDFIEALVQGLLVALSDPTKVSVDLSTVTAGGYPIVGLAKLKVL